MTRWTDHLYQAGRRRSHSEGRDLIVLEFYAMTSIGNDIKTVLDTLDFAEQEKSALDAKVTELQAALDAANAKLANAVLPDADDVTEFAALSAKAAALRAPATPAVAPVAQPTAPAEPAPAAVEPATPPATLPGVVA